MERNGNSHRCELCGKELKTRDTQERYLYFRTRISYNYFPMQDWELSDYEEKPPIYYIRGNEERGDEVIKMLKEKGGIRQHLSGKGDREDLYYFIDYDNDIFWCNEYSSYANLLKRYGIELHLPEKVEKKEDGHLISQDELDKLANDIFNDIKELIDNAFKKLHFTLKEE